MFVPYAALIGPHWAGMLSGGARLGAMHVLMLPAMASLCCTGGTNTRRTTNGTFARTSRQDAR